MLDIQVFEKFKSKAGCRHSQRSALSYWRQIKPYLSDKDIRNIHVAWQHFLIGEGRCELDNVCNLIISDYKRGENA